MFGIKKCVWDLPKIILVPPHETRNFRFYIVLSFSNICNQFYEMSISDDISDKIRSNPKIYLLCGRGFIIFFENKLKQKHNKLALILYCFGEYPKIWMVFPLKSFFPGLLLIPTVSMKIEIGFVMTFLSELLSKLVRYETLFVHLIRSIRFPYKLMRLFKCPFSTWYFESSAFGVLILSIFVFIFTEWLAIRISHLYRR